MVPLQFSLTVIYFKTIINLKTISKNPRTRTQLRNASDTWCMPVAHSLAFHSHKLVNNPHPIQNELKHPLTPTHRCNVRSNRSVFDKSAPNNIKKGKEEQKCFLSRDVHFTKRYLFHTLVVSAAKPVISK